MRRGRTRAEHAPEAANRLAAAPACCWLCLWHTNGERRSLQRSLVVEREAHSDGVHARVAPASGGAVVRLSVPQAARRRSHHLPQVLAEGRLEDQFVPRRLVVVGLSHRSCQAHTPRRDTGCEPLSRCGHRSRPCCSGPSLGEPTRPDAGTHALGVARADTLGTASTALLCAADCIASCSRVTRLVSVARTDDLRLRLLHDLGDHLRSILLVENVREAALFVPLIAELELRLKHLIHDLDGQAPLEPESRGRQVRARAPRLVPLGEQRARLGQAQGQAQAQRRVAAVWGGSLRRWTTASRRSPLVVVRLCDVGVLIHLDGGVSSWKVLHGERSGAGKEERLCSNWLLRPLLGGPVNENASITSRSVPKYRDRGTSRAATHCDSHR